LRNFHDSSPAKAEEEAATWKKKRKSAVTLSRPALPELLRILTSPSPKTDPVKLRKIVQREEETENIKKERNLHCVHCKNSSRAREIAWRRPF